ncbi:MAG TPA: bacillithiol biosynthesis deacetylase BshB1 [Candidatus Kapabacteria bacterium]|nr:bacillithiol biosynthesis deacetylase BshB1 [Candidatus Kapabacteria bacterium]
MKLDILALAAHPDDVELACAGTLLMNKRAGKRTGIIDCTQGELSTRGTLESRARETDAASQILELDYRANLHMSDGNIELSQENLLRVIVQLRKTRPTILLAPSPHERHPDHEAAAELAHRAAFYAGLVKIETTDDEGNAQEPHRPLLVLHYMQGYSFEPTIIVDVSPVFEERMKAMEAFGSQFNPGQKSDKSGAGDRMTILSQPGFVDGLRARASHYGMMIGVRHAEPFWAQTALGTKDLFSLVTKTIA